MGSLGASMGGTLNDAKIVRESRSVNNIYVGEGSGRAATGLKRRVKWVSFQRQRDRFVREVAANLDVPWVVALAGEGLIVEDAVSIAFAERYVPVYSACVVVRQKVLGRSEERKVIRKSSQTALRRRMSAVVETTSSVTTLHWYLTSWYQMHSQ